MLLRRLWETVRQEKEVRSRRGGGQITSEDDFQMVLEACLGLFWDALEEPSYFESWRPHCLSVGCRRARVICASEAELPFSHHVRGFRLAVSFAMLEITDPRTSK